MHLVASSSCSWEPRSPKKRSVTRTNVLPREPPALFPLTTPRMHRPRRQELPRLASVGPHRARSRFPESVFPVPLFFSLSFSFTVVRCRSRGFDGPRGGFPGRRGPTEGASHARLGHELRPSDLLKISIALVHRPLVLLFLLLRTTSGPNRPTIDGTLPPTHCTPVFLSFLPWRGGGTFSGTGERHAQGEISRPAHLELEFLSENLEYYSI